jgi:2,4'-dihydroxyacetophenone dioxygenase
MSRANTEKLGDGTASSAQRLPGATPEYFIAEAASADERYYVPVTATVSSRPLWISPSRNQWCEIVCAQRAGYVSRHFDINEVFAYTLSGSWGYAECDWVATAGHFLHEKPGGRHTLIAYDGPGPMSTLPCAVPITDGSASATPISTACCARARSHRRGLDAHL